MQDLAKFTISASHTGDPFIRCPECDDLEMAENAQEVADFVVKHSHGPLPGLFGALLNDVIRKR